MLFRQIQFRLALLLGFVAMVCAASAELLPIEDLFKNPDRSQMTLSPTGRYIAALAPMNGRMNLFVVDTKSISGKWLTGFKDENVASYSWANDERLLFQLDGTGSPTLRTALFSVRVDGSGLKDIVPALERHSQVFRYTRILDLLPSDPNEILVVSNERRSEYPDVYRMKVDRAGKKLVVRNPGDITGWMVDRKGVVRLGIAVSEDGMTQSIRLRENEKAEWKEIGSFRRGARAWTPVMFAEDNDQLIVMSDLKSDRTELYRYDWRTGELVEKLWGAPDADVVDVIFSGKRNKIVGVWFEGDEPGVHWFDPEFAALQKDLDLAFPGERVVLAPADQDGYGPSDREETRFLVRSSSTKTPVSYHLLDGKSFEMQRVSNTRPWIKGDQMAETKSIRFTARDGREIPGYLTLPVGSNGKNLPLVLHPHGGPWARDSLVFNPEVQYFASRGFAVLQVNYRGSTGYGRDHLMAGRKEFGQAMQNDLIDGVNWAIKEGIADPKRVGVYGASYGGYATMVALTKTPDMFQWGINYVGVVDLIKHINWYRDIEREGGYQYWSYMVGDPKDPDDAKALAANSPINYVDQIKVPLFVIHGVEDVQVSVEQSLDLIKLLEQNHVKFIQNIKKKEGHGYQREENRIELYRQFDEFLAPYITR